VRLILAFACLAGLAGAQVTRATFGGVTVHSAAGGGTPAYVQAWGGASGATTGATFTTSAATTTSGDTIVVAFTVKDTSGTNPTLTCSDNEGNTYTSSTRLDTANSLSAFHMQFCWALAITGGSGHTITVTSSAADADTSFWRVHVHEISGATAMDQASLQSGSANATSPTITVQAHEFALGYGLNGTGTAGALGTGWTLGIAEGAEATEYQIPSSTAGLAATYTNDGSDYLAGIITFD
jgi:hypothetical protein